MAQRAPARKAPETSRIRFRAQIREIGHAAILSLPDDASAKLPSRGQVAVEGVMNRHAFQTVLEPDGRRGHWLKVDEKLRQALAGSESGTVAVQIEPTKDWPEPDIPRDFQSALADAPGVSELWNDITPMTRWEWVRWINATKNPETANDASRWVSRNFNPVSDVPAASISQHAPTRTYRRTADC